MDDKFFTAIRYTEIINDIIDTAHNVHDPADFGAQVACILYNEQLLPEALFEIIYTERSDENGENNRWQVYYNQKW